MLTQAAGVEEIVLNHDYKCMRFSMLLWVKFTMQKVYLNTKHFSLRVGLVLFFNKQPSYKGLLAIQ